MATISSDRQLTAQNERLFFFYMALALAGTAIFGFVRFLALGMSNFGEPWWVHLHGISMMGWLTIYVLQNALIVRGDFGLHRQLGALAILWSIWVPIVGAMTLAFATQANRVPPFFTPEYMIALDGCCVMAFCGLTWAGAVLRQQRGWHKRLILGGTIIIIQPGIGRFLPGFMLGPSIGYYAFPVHLLFFVIAMIYDVRTRGRIHPAYFWGVGVLALMTVATPALANFPPFVAMVGSLKG